MNETKSTRCVMLRVLFAAALVLMFAAAGVGAVSAEEPIQIGSAEQWNEFATSFNSGGSTSRDIVITQSFSFAGIEPVMLGDVECNEWGYLIPESVISYAGSIRSIDGEVKTISDFVIEGNDSYVGLIRHYSGAGIENLKISNFSVSGTDYVGGLVGGYVSTNCQFTNVSAEFGSVIASGSDVGGLIGGAVSTGNAAFDGTINFDGCKCLNCSVAATDGGIVGGLAGKISTNGAIDNCNVENTLIYSYSSNAGGLVGDGGSDYVIKNSNVKNCVVATYDDEYVGGLIGASDTLRNEKIVITECKVEKCTIYGEGSFMGTPIGGLAGDVGSQSSGSNNSVLSSAVSGYIGSENNAINSSVSDATGSVAAEELNVTYYSTADSSSPIDFEVDSFWKKVYWSGVDTTPYTTLGQYGVPGGYGYGSAPLPPVAKIGTTEYTTLEDAISAAQSGETITLIADVDLTQYAANEFEQLNFPDGAIFDLMGHSITSNNGGVVYQGKNLVIKNGTFIAAKGGSYAIFVGDGPLDDEESIFTSATLDNLQCTGGINVFCADVTINDSSSTAVGGTKYYAIWCDENARVTVNGGDFTSSSTKGGSVLNCYCDEPGSWMKINGGTYTAENPVTVFADDTTSFITVYGGIFCDDGEEFKDNLDNHLASGYNAVSIGEHKWDVQVADPVAKIGETTYLTLKDAVDAVETGETIELLADITLNAPVRLDKEGTFTIDGANHTISVAEGADFGADGCLCFGKGGVYVDGGEVIMSGGTIAENKVSIGGHGGCGVYVCDGTFTMTNGSITNNNVTGNYDNGGGVNVVSNGKFIMNGGSITNNNAIGENGNGGGVNVAESGEFTMNDGRIVSNSANEGGGVNVVSNGKFFMNSGSITENSAKTNGAGVYVYTGEFTMSNGSITKNNVTGEGGKGGGVYFSGSTFTLSGGSITENSVAGVNGKGGGVYVESGTFNVEKSPVIKENTKKTDSSINNVYLDYNKRISVIGLLTSGAYIGIINPDNTYSSFGEVSSSVSAEELDLTCFHPDDTTSERKAKLDTTTDPKELKWGIEYTVTFDVQGHGTAPDAKPVWSGDTVPKPKDPTEAGYTFGGWYTNPDTADMDKWDFKTDPVYYDMTLYAKWTANTYTVTLDGNGSTASITATYDAVFEVSAPTKEGHTFTGWTVAGTNPNYETAKYGKSSDSVDTTITEETKCIGTNASSSVWFKNLSTTPNGSVTLTATWNLNAPEITFDGTSYSSGSNVTKAYKGQPGYTLTAFSSVESGYTVEWTGPEDRQINSISKDIIIKDVSQSGTYTAKLINSSSDVVEKTAEITITITPVELQLSWTDDSLTYNGSEQAPTVAISSGKISGDDVAVSVSEESKKKDANTGSETYTAAAELTGEQKGNYTIKSGDESHSFTISPSNVIVTWPETTALPFNGQEQEFKAANVTGIFNAEVTQTYEGNKATAVGNYTAKLTLTVAGTASNYILPTQNPATCNWSITAGASHTVTYKIGDETYGTPESHIYGEIVTVKEKGTKTGYAVGDWTSSDVTIDDGKFTMADKDVTITATAVANTYTIAYTLDGGTAGTSQPTSGTYDVVFKVSAPTKEGHTFTGWKVAGTNPDYTTAKYGKSSDSVETAITEETKCIGTNASSSVWFKNLSTIANGSVTLTATWSTNDYEITIDSAIQHGTVTYEEVPSNSLFETTIQITAVPNTGYQLKADSIKVYKTGDTATEVPVTNNRFTVPAFGVTITAEFKPNTYNITYNLDGGTAGTSQPTSGTYDAVFEVSAPTKEGHTFTGWTVAGTNPDYTTAKYGASESSVETPITADTKCIGTDASSSVWFKNLSTTANGSVTLTATWSTNNYEITIDSAIQHGTVTYEEVPSNSLFETTIQITATPAAGYQLKADSIKVYKTGDPATEVTVTNNRFTVPAFGVTITAEFKPNPYNISYELAGGTAGTSQPSSGTYDAVFEVSAPTKEGHTFTGWTVAGTNPDYTTAKYGVSASSVENAITADTKCIGTDASSSVWFKNLSTTANGSVTLTAAWSTNDYEITIDSAIQHGTVTYEEVPSNSLFETTIQITATPAAGYQLKADSIKVYKTGDQTTEVPVTNNRFTVPAFGVTITAEFEPKEYNITYNLDGGTAGTSQPTSGTYDAVFEVSAPTKAGYTFTGWTVAGTNPEYTTAKYGVSASSVETPITADTKCIGTVASSSVWFKNLSTTANGSVTLTATWSTNDYEITIDSAIQHGTVTYEEVPSNSLFETTIQITATPAAGYQLKADSIKVYKTGDTATEVPVTNNQFTVPAFAVTITAEFEPKEYNITYNLDGGTAGTTQPTTGTYDAVFEVSAPTKEGHTFTGWTVAGTNPEYTTAKYGASESSVETPITADTKCIGTDASSSVWFKNLSTTANGSVTLTATWSTNNYEITIDSAIQHGTVTYEEVPSNSLFETTIQITAVPDTGYQLKADSIKVYKTGDTATEVPVTNNRFTVPAFGVTITAEFEPKEYNITYNLDGGTAGTTQPTTGTYDAVFEVSAPTKEGHTFTGWTVAGTNPEYTTAKYGVSASSVETPIAADTKCIGTDASSSVWFKNLSTTANGSVTLTAAWSTNDYEITIDSAIQHGTVTYEEVPSNSLFETTIQITAVPDTGYQLKADSIKVYKTGDTETEVPVTNNRFTVPAFAVTITAEFEPKEYNITYNLAGGTAGTSQPTSGTYDAVFEVSAPTKEGHTFTGWTVAGTNPEYTTAKYGASESSVETPITADTKCIGTDASSSVWFKNLSTTENGSVTLTATWTANPKPSSSSRSSGSSVWLPAASPDTQGAQITHTITAQYAGNTFIGVTAGDIAAIRTVSPEIAAAAEIKISTAKAAGIKVTNSKGAPALILTNAAEGLDTVTFSEVYDIKPTNPNEKLTQVTVTVPKADVAASGLTTDDVTIYHFLEAYDIWVPLDTLQITEDEANYYYTAATDGASPFGVLIKRFDTEPVKPAQTSSSPAPLAAVLAGLGAAGVLFGLRRK